MSKPTFEDACVNALWALATVSDDLRSRGWADTGLTRGKTTALREARTHIERAMAALGRARDGGAR
jgi:hypothetical protein